MDPVAFFDVDGTLTSENVWRGLMEYFRRHRLRRGTHLAFLAVHYPLYAGKLLGLMGETRFRSVWAAHLAWYLRGSAPQEAAAVWDWVVMEFLPPYWRADVRQRLEAHLRAGERVMLVSAGPQPLLERIASHLGAQHAAGTRLAVGRGRYTGRARPPVCLDVFKVKRAREVLQEAGVQVDWEATWAYADSHTDIPLLKMAAHPVAVYPDETLREAACALRWELLPPASCS